jgi:adenine phosphoribosyltransferase
VLFSLLVGGLRETYTKYTFFCLTQDVFEIQKSGVKPGSRVVIVDDLIATGGSAGAAGQLIKKCDATVVEYVFVMELDFLNGRKSLDAPVYSLIHL